MFWILFFLFHENSLRRMVHCWFYRQRSSTRSFRWFYHHQERRKKSLMGNFSIDCSDNDVGCSNTTATATSTTTTAHSFIFLIIKKVFFLITMQRFSCLSSWEISGLHQGLFMCGIIIFFNVKTQFKGDWNQIMHLMHTIELQNMCTNKSEWNWNIVTMPNLMELLVAKGAFKVCEIETCLNWSPVKMMQCCTCR